MDGARHAARRPNMVGVDVIGAKDLRIIDMKAGMRQHDRARSPSLPPRPPIRRGTTCTSTAGCAPTMATK